MSNPARTLIRSGSDGSIVRWDEMPPEAPHVTFHVKRVNPDSDTGYDRAVFPKFSEADAFLRNGDMQCPLLLY